jgi:hypothetical protein
MNQEYLEPFRQWAKRQPGPTEQKTEVDLLREELQALERKVNWMESLLAARIQLQSKDVLAVLDAAVEIQTKRKR